MVPGAARRITGRWIRPDIGPYVVGVALDLDQTRQIGARPAQPSVMSPVGSRVMHGSMANLSDVGNSTPDEVGLLSPQPASPRRDRRSCFTGSSSVVTIAGIEVHFRNFIAAWRKQKLFPHFSEARAAIFAPEKVE